MRIEFDPAKDAANLSKHGVSLALAAELDWEAALVWVDERFEYGEMRMVALAPKTEILAKALDDNFARDKAKDASLLSLAESLC